jgi:hypothetical protein
MNGPPTIVPASRWATGIAQWIVEIGAVLAAILLAEFLVADFVLHTEGVALLLQGIMAFGLTVAVLAMFWSRHLRRSRSPSVGT